MSNYQRSFRIRIKLRQERTTRSAVRMNPRFDRPKQPSDVSEHVSKAEFNTVNHQTYTLTGVAGESRWDVVRRLSKLLDDPDDYETEVGELEELQVEEIEDRPPVSLEKTLKSIGMIA